MGRATQVIVLSNERDQQLKRTFEVVKAYGLTPVRIRAGQKAPTSDWDPRRVISDPSTVTNDLGDDNLAVHLHGRVVDVDVDSFDPLVPAALDMCLPQSTLTWGRKSKPRSHRLYVLDEDFDRGPFAPLLRVTKALEIDGTSLSVEVRGGERASGFVSVLPGSQHPGGELYTWDALDLSSSPAVVRVPDLISSVRLALAAAMVARFWVSGVRNDMSLALSGALWRMHALMVSAAEITDADPPDFSASMNRAELLLRTVMELVGDDPADARDRVTNLRNTWRKLERDPSIRTVGATRMAELIGDELGQQVVRRLYLLLADDAGALKFDELTERFRIWYGQGVLIDLELVRRGLTQFWMTKEQAANSMGGGSVLLGGKKVLVSKLLFSSLAVGRVYGVTFDPTTTEMVVDTDVGALVNQWRGFRVKPHPEPVTDDDIRPFLAYVFEVVASGDEKAVAWVLDWCADILQFPGRKPGTALVLVGPPGAGKTFLGECVMGAIIGPSHYGQTNSIASLTDRFNQLVDNKVLLQCDEAMHAWQRDLAARLKALVTDLTLRIEPKFVNPFIKPNHMRFLFTSNEETAALFIDATPTERRFTVLKVSDRRQEDVAYWEHLRGWAENNLPQIARWLMDRRYNKAALNRPYSTSAKRAMQSVGMPMEAAWLVDRVQSGFPLSPETHAYWWQAFHTDREKEAESANQLLADTWPDRITLQAIEQDFLGYVRHRGKQLHTGNVWLTLRSVFPDGSVEPVGQRSVQMVDPKTQTARRVRIRLYSFPTLAQICAHLSKKYGQTLDAPPEDSQPQPPSEY